MIHYHGGPPTPETCARRTWKGRHAFVTWAYPSAAPLAAALCQTFALDNGAFTSWTKKRDPDWPGYYAWAEEWLSHPACDFAIIPDVIDGTEAENDALVDAWPLGHRGVPVWHLNESPDRLVRLAADWPRVALGSAAEYDVKIPAQALRRLAEVLPLISDGRGRPKVKLHGLRMLNPVVVTQVPLASADSTNVARNGSLDQRWAGPYEPATVETRCDVLAERIEQFQSPATMTARPLTTAPSLFDWIT